MRRWLRLIGTRDGQVLYIVAGSMVVILGMSALAIDLGLLYHAKTEAQRAADASALAGAGILLQTRNVGSARDAAIEWAALNQVRGEDVLVLPADVDVIADSQKVRVRVLRTVERGNPVQTLFARVLGFDRVSVSAMAAAQAYPAGGVNCLLPFAIPDRWRESDGSWPTITDNFRVNQGDVYVPWTPSSDPSSVTGYGPGDRGYRIQLRGPPSGGGGQAANAWEPGWWYAFVPGGGPPAQPTLYSNIIGCDDEVFSLGDDHNTQPGVGSAAGPGFRCLIAGDPDAYWDGTCNCVRRPNGDVVTDSPRIRPLALFDPRDPPSSGRSPLTLTNFVGVFIESVTPAAGGTNGPGGNSCPYGGGTGGGGGASQLSVWVRFIEYTGVVPADQWSNAGPIVRVLRLVE